MAISMSERPKGASELSDFMRLQAQEQIFTRAIINSLMIEILVTLMLSLITVLAAKRGRKRRYNLRMVRFNNRVAGGALASLDVTSGSIMDAATNPYRLVTVKASYSWTDIPNNVDGGMTFGLAHSDYTAAEIEECLEAQGAIDRGDKIALEQSNRLVRQIGVMESRTTSAASGTIVFNDGRQIKTKLNWYIGVGDGISIWMRNASNTAWSTGSNIQIAGEMYVKDSV